jgi:SWI/SNF-related matrix-associated actin-dependent regulator of chromatin subfamily A3
MKKGRSDLDASVSGHVENRSRNTMLRILLKLRIFCNQGTFTNEDGHQLLDADEHLTWLEEREEAFCVCCFSSVALINQPDDPNSAVLGECFHILCCLCYSDAAVDSPSSMRYDCPECGATRKPHDFLADNVTTINVPGLEEHSSKLNALTKDLLLTQNHPDRAKR